MSSRSTLFWSRTRSAARVLLALGVITAIAALLLAAIISAVRVPESAAVLRGIDAAPGDRGELTVSLNDGESAGQEANIQRALREVGVGGAMTVTSVGDSRYEIAPDPARFTADDAMVLAQQNVPSLGRAISDATGTTARVSGGLLVTLADATEGVETRRGPTSMAIGIVALVAAVVVAAASVEPVRQRLSERALLRARGMSRWGLLRLALGDVVPVIAISSVVGAAVGALVIRLITRTVMPLWIPVAIAVGFTLVGTVSTTIATLRGVDRRSTRADAFAGIAAVLILGVLTGVAAWQFWRVGTAVVVRSDGVITVDPLVALAPALGLVLFALVAVVLARPIATAIAWPASKGKGLGWVLPLRLAARRTSRHALTTGVVAFTAATITLASVYHASLGALGDMPEQLRVGTDVRVKSVTEQPERDLLADLDAVSAAMPVREAAVRDPGGNYPLLLVTSNDLAETMSDANGLIDVAALGTALNVPLFGVPIDSSPATISLTIPNAEKWGEDFPWVDAMITVVDAEGMFQRRWVQNVELVEQRFEDEHGTTIYSDWHSVAARSEPIELVGTPPWRLVSIQAMQPAYPQLPNASVEVGLSVDGVQLDLSGMTGSGFTSNGNSLTFDLNQPTTARAGDAPARYPIVITQALADSINVQVGSMLSLPVDNSLAKLDVEVVDVVPLIPGIAGGPGAMLDYRALALSDEDPQPTNELWLKADATTTPTALAAEVESTLPTATADAFDSNVIESAGETAFAFGLAAAGAAALALVALVLRRSRSGDDTDRELGTLAVLGLGRKGAARARAKEDVFAIGLGVIGGVIGGLAISWLIVPSLIRGVYPRMPQTYPVDVVVPWLHLALAVLLVTAVFGAVAASVRAPRSLASVLREAE